MKKLFHIFGVVSLLFVVKFSFGLDHESQLPKERSFDILNVPDFETNVTMRKNNYAAFACGVKHDETIPNYFTNCTDFCTEFCYKNDAIEVGGTNYENCRCTVFNNAVVNAGCCTGSFSDFDVGQPGYTCEDDICGSCFGEAICFMLNANSNGNFSDNPPVESTGSVDTIKSPSLTLLPFQLLIVMMAMLTFPIY